jgi:Fic family protein
MNRDALCHAVRQTLTRLPPPLDSHYGVVPAPPTEESIALGDARAANEAAISALAEMQTLTQELGDPWLVSRIITRQEALSSSAVEGTHSTLDEILALDEDDGADTVAATRQVLSYALTLDRLIPAARVQGNALFTTDLVQDLHRAVMREDPDYKDVPGAFRQDVVWIGGDTRNIATSTWNPPPPDRVADCITHNVDYMGNQGMQRVTQGLFTRMAIAHAHFEAVHPFRDGNGRVGRLLLPLMMAADGHVPLYLSPFVEANRHRYYASLKAAQQQLDWSAIVSFLADAVIETVKEVKVTRNALHNLRRVWHQKRRFRAESASLRALDALTNYPVLTINRLAVLLDISFPAASKAVSQLVDAGILSERTGYQRNRLFAATEVLSIINRPFGSEPVLPE